MAKFLVSQCGSCQARIIWTVTEATGSRAPVDYEPAPNGNIALEPRPVGVPISRVIPAHERDGKVLRLNHFATCPKAKQHRAHKPKNKQTKTSRVRDHLYQGDGIPDHNGQDRCTVCRLPKHRCPNRLPATPDDIRHAEARRYGETELENI